MIPAQRRALILDLVRAEGAAAVTQLGEKLGISSSTVRRDLGYLTEQGYLERSHGGAVVKTAPNATFEPHPDISSHVARSAKVAIARQAASMVRSGQSVIFDSSSTVLAAAREVMQQNLTITAVTNDLTMASLLATAPKIRLVVTGGAARPGSFTLTGDPGQSFLDGLQVDLAFIGIHSLANRKLSETSIEVAAMKRKMVQAARTAVVLADSSKFEHPAFCEVVKIQEVQRVVTDASAPPDHIEALRRLGIDVVVAPLANSDGG